MTSVTFRKTLLALAVSSASLPVHAATWQLSDSGLVKTNESFADSVEILGSYAGGDDAIELEGVTLERELVLNATIQTEGDFSGGIDLNNGDGSSQPTDIKDSLVNKGSISAFGNGSAAMLLDPAIVGGDLINEGSLNAKGGFLEGEGARGLDLSVTTVAGNVHNKGTITAEGEKAKAIWVSYDRAGDTNIGGSLINSGTIRATDLVTKWSGEWDDPVTNRVLTGAVGIHLEDVSIQGDIINEGTIEANGDRAMGMLLEGTQLNGKLINRGVIRVDGERSSGIDTTSLNDQSAKLQQIVNEGSIIATGTAAEGMVISFTSDDPKVINTGTIKAEGTAIFLEDFVENEGDKFLVIEHRAGLISGGVAAIASYGNDVDLMWSGGKIQGDILLGSSNSITGYGPVVVISGNAEFDGDRIHAYSVDVGSIPEDTTSFDGHLELEGSYTTIDGNLWVGGGSSLGMKLDNTTDANTAILSVSNNAVFAEGAQIKLAARGSDFSAEGTTYTLVKAASIDNGTANDNLEVSSRSALLNIDTVKVDDTQVLATVTAKSPGQVAASVRQHGASRNAQSAIRGFIPIMGRLDENDPVFVAFSHANESEMAKLAEQLSPEANGGSKTAAVTGQTMISNVTSSRTSSARQGLSSGRRSRKLVFGPRHFTAIPIKTCGTVLPVIMPTVAESPSGPTAS
ncbi:MAG: hypothetical protein UMU75_00280 [Halomonas sp.]|nr:hypothetical protein [Halomonas sp.]